MIRPLQQLIDALRFELLQYGEVLARLDEPSCLTRRQASPGIGPEWETQIESLLLARQSRQRWQLQLAWAAGRPESAAFENLLPILPKHFRPLVTALAAENESLWQRISTRLGTPLDPADALNFSIQP